MDAARKAALEKRVVLGLVGVFLLTVVLGPMKSLGWLKPRAPHAPPAPVEKVTMSKPLGDVMGEYWKRVDPEVSQQEVDRGAAEPAATPAYYTAQDLRDPFQSLLPQPPSVSAPPTGASTATPPPPVPKRPAPDLRVEGVLWGGPTPSAIIDGEVYRVGDTIQDDTILDIDRQGMTLEHEGDRILYPPIRQ